MMMWLCGKIRRGLFANIQVSHLIKESLIFLHAANESHIFVQKY